MSITSGSSRLQRGKPETTVTLVKRITRKRNVGRIITEDYSMTCVMSELT